LELIISHSFVKFSKMVYNRKIILRKKIFFLDHEDCPLGKIGPQCLVDCGFYLESYDNCKETVICYKDGCTCPPGFLGSKCSACKCSLPY